MDQKQAVRQLIDFQKSSFDNSFNAMVMIQEQAEKMAKTFLDQANWLPDDGKNVLNQWIGAYKKGRAEFKKSVDENFQKVDEYFSTLEKEKSK
ncbi:MAG: hypothetical protein ACOX3E_01905 [Desulfomonilia bacterium]|uniref:Phasin protein n=1 Tax=anaerobic digester metagenome TaxID=1263854 RepID=A0A485M3Z0_9ZZZZ|nr:hypothetical protein [Pseudomonadota bacterium]HON38791.1 hypothetical protein [Deltaproteobacteria bacterium]HRS56668.1 hypothetical protein [Desulfomonilia bacterium]HPD20285.1 hypothetical protein [Deltaproteobacteria bacterium]HPX17670.1 hypothetical protein [Deltaproteobacteria bacterium]